MSEKCGDNEIAFENSSQMGAGDQITLVLVDALVHQSHAEVIMRDGLLLGFLYLRGKSRGTVLDSLPIFDGKAYLHHLLVTGKAMSMVPPICIPKVPERNTPCALL